MEDTGFFSNLPKFPDFVKHPLHVVLYILLTYFIYKEFTKKDECIELRNIVITQEKRIATLEESNGALVNAILVKNGIIDDIKRNTDSLVYKKVGNQAKTIVQ